jgi:hypothetical protein
MRPPHVVVSKMKNRLPRQPGSQPPRGLVARAVARATGAAPQRAPGPQPEWEPGNVVRAEPVGQRNARRPTGPRGARPASWSARHLLGRTECLPPARLRVDVPAPALAEPRPTRSVKAARLAVIDRRRERPAAKLTRSAGALVQGGRPTDPFGPSAGPAPPFPPFLAVRSDRYDERKEAPASPADKPATGPRRNQNRVQ